MTIIIILHFGMKHMCHFRLCLKFLPHFSKVVVSYSCTSEVESTDCKIVRDFQ